MFSVPTWGSGGGEGGRALVGGGGGVGGGVASGRQGLEGPGAVLGRGERVSRPALLGVLLVEGEAQGLGCPVSGSQGGRGGG